MAVFNFDQVDDYVQSSNDGFNFLKLQDNGWIAKVRFMYGAGETFQGYSVHNVSTDPKKPKFVECLHQVGEPLDTCPLCKAGVLVQAQFYIPVYVESITKCINNIPQPEEPVNQVMIFQRGKTFAGALSSAIRQSHGTPLINNVFNIVRNGKVGDMKTTYSIEFVERDNTTFETLGVQAPVIKGSYILPETSYEDMLKYVPGNNNVPSGVVARTPQAVAQPAQANYQSSYQAPPQAPGIPF